MGIEEVEENTSIPDLNSLRYAFIDTEVGLKDHKIHDIGILRQDEAVFHSASRPDALDFIKECDYICGHNIVHHDANYLFPDGQRQWTLVDTLYMSPLLFPEHPYHNLVKDDKLLSEQANNPVNDCKKAKILLEDEIERWAALPKEKRQIYTGLLAKQYEFQGFLSMVNANSNTRNLSKLIIGVYEGLICSHADIAMIIRKYPCELAYALALIETSDHRSITPGWVLHQYPAVEHVMALLREKPCRGRCAYCESKLDIHRNLKRFFGYDEFRTYEGEPLQEQACQAAIEEKSLLAIFPTGGGKSLTFQLPALIAGQTVHGLTVVISPLLSLMKDQVDNLAERGITEVATINGLLDPITRANCIQRVQDGGVSLLYIAPEMLRSKTIERILMARHVVRFVIDEAHCFSAWGQDFRVDYMYIAHFIKRLQEQKGLPHPIPVSCFTATAKQKVIQDICDYFKQNLDLDLTLLASSAARTNLHYSVIHSESEEDKYNKLRALVSASDCPTIVYVSRTKRTCDLASKLSRDGFKALPFNGRMGSDEKIANQDAFMNDRVRIIVATSAFGMGVDKKDVGLVIHYDISDSLENYVQEAGRAGRDPHLSARCFVLYGDDDLDKHFILLNQTKLSLKEINQVWSAVRYFTKQRERFCKSALEIARQAGWDDSVTDIEMRVRTALAALEQAGYIERGSNVPHVYATGITVRNMDEARKRLESSRFFENGESENAVRIIKSLISKKYTSNDEEQAESRIDYLADILGLTKREVVSAVERMTQEGILANNLDMSAYLLDDDATERKTKMRLERFARLEQYIISHVTDESLCTTYKQINESATNSGISTAREKDVKTLLYFLAIRRYMHCRKNGEAMQGVTIERIHSQEQTLKRYEKRMAICRFAVEWLYGKVTEKTTNDTQRTCIQFSVVELQKELEEQNAKSLFQDEESVTLEDVEEALLYLSKIDALKLEGGFLVLYNTMDIRRIKESRFKYKQEDYRLLNDFYKMKMQQIHIVGEYANLMVKDYNAALQYVHDYFQMDYRKFLAKYFKGERQDEIQRNLSPKKYRQLMGQLSQKQMEVISDKDSRCIVVAAGPGSGKTRVLVHKLASLLILEDVKHEQLLMLTFSRAAATEFKQRLMQLIGNATHFVEIKTFHAYCFDLLGRTGNVEEMDNVVGKAAELIKQGEVEPSKIGKLVLVIDEEQDMGEDEYALVKALMDANEDMRVIAVGDDDQNIYAFRGSSSQHMFRLTQEKDARFIEMTENFRSARHIVDAANSFARLIRHRMKRTPILSMSQHEGCVEITHYTSSCLYEPLARCVQTSQDKGTTCLLTQTNEEAVIMVALLRKHGINSRLVQATDGFRFWNLAEVRYFLKQLKQGKDSSHSRAIISDETWEGAKNKTYSHYATSSSLPYIKRCIELFEKTNNVKYLSDLQEYLFESSVEDFCDTSGRNNEVIISTIHKSKGREYDNVYMMVTGRIVLTEEQCRKFYVAITRAKEKLSIHTDGTIFNCIRPDLSNTDTQEYSLPDEIVLQLNYKEVNLGFFKSRKREVLSLTAGDELAYRDYLLYNTHTGFPVVQLSQKMQSTIQDWQTRGYEVTSASVRFIVAWKPKDAPKEEEESAVLLADLTLKNRNALPPTQARDTSVRTR